MIEIGKYCHISENEIACIRVEATSDRDFPYQLTVYLKNGKSFFTRYKDLLTCEKESRFLARQVEHLKRVETERVLVMLSTLKLVVEKIDRRQLRIWRQLKTLLGISVEEEK